MESSKAEKEYIEREAAIIKIREEGIYGSGYSNQEREENVVDMIESIPAADVRPVVRGWWKDAMQSCHDSPHVKCSVCGEYYWRYFKKFNYCPNCGADMRQKPT